MKFIDKTGQKYGRLTVLYRLPNQGKKTKWQCLCACGNLSAAISTDLSMGKHASCGCLHREAITKHGHTNRSGYRSPTYTSWTAMMSRCYNAHSRGYFWYGRRGITVCQRWHEFENFLADMKERPEGRSLDRINNAIGYSPENCRWATRAEQTANQSHPKPAPRARDKRTGRFISD